MRALRLFVMGVAAGSMGLIGHGPVAWAQDRIFVRTTDSGNFVMTYSRTANGDIAPVRTLAGSGGSGTLRVDAVNNELVVTVSTGLVRTYALTASGSDSPLRQIGGDQTGMVV